MSIIGEMAKWACDLSLSDVPPRVVEACRAQILSVLGSIFAGSRSSAGKALARAVSIRSEKGKCSCFGLDERKSLLSALLHNTSLSMALDYDDYMFLGHTGHSAVLVPLALGEFLESRGEEALKAQVVANEIGGRLGASVVLGPHNGQMWTYIHSMSAAAAGSVLLGLDAEKTAHAMGIALSEPPFPLYPGFIACESKTLCASIPALTGVISAFLASEGLRGPVDIIECGGGFWENFSYVPLPVMMSGLGKAWVSDTIAIKPYPGCAYITACVEAALSLLEEIKNRRGRELICADIEEIEVRAGLLTLMMEQASKKYGSFKDLTPPSINFSAAKSIAIALLSGDLSGFQFDDRFIEENRDEILKIAAKVNLIHDPELTLKFIREIDTNLGIKKILPHVKKSKAKGLVKLAKEHLSSRAPSSKKRLIPRASRISFEGIGYIFSLALSFLFGKLKDYELPGEGLRNLRFPFGAELVLRLSDGFCFSRKFYYPKGAPGSGISRWDVAEEKFLKESYGILGEKSAKEVLRAVRRLEEMSVKEFNSIANGELETGQN